MKIKFLGDLPLIEEIAASAEKRAPIVTTNSEIAKLFAMVVERL